VHIQAVRQLALNLLCMLQHAATSLCTALQRQAEGAGAGDVQAWDTAYYIGRAKAQQYSLNGTSLSAYLPLDRCISGLASICHSLFGEY
jgi:Zn-dependent oligopeptidase